MARIYKSADMLIGRTPLMSLEKIKKKYGLEANVIAKLEMFNPCGSVKDRVAKAMLDDAERDGRLTKNSVIIEPTSGNTGIALAAVAVSRGYKAVIVMPDNMSAERRALVKAYGAELVLTPAEEGVAGAIRRAEEIAAESPDNVIAGQFTNPSNPAIHRATTGPEIYEDMDGQVDVFVACVGTGGTLSGIGQYLKSVLPNVRIVAVEPSSSNVLSGGKAGPHGIQGIGAGFIPEILDTEVYDEVICIDDEEAFRFGREIGQTEGILAGISSGCALCAAVKLAMRPENKGKNIVTLFPDTGDRYLSTAMFDCE